MLRGLEIENDCTVVFDISLEWRFVGVTHFSVLVLGLWSLIWSAWSILLLTVHTIFYTHKNYSFFIVKHRLCQHSEVQNTAKQLPIELTWRSGDNSKMLEIRHRLFFYTVSFHSPFFCCYCCSREEILVGSIPSLRDFWVYIMLNV